MTDFTKLNAKPWCGCCTNEQVFRAAEELCDHVIQKHYVNPMCMASSHSVIAVARFLFGFVLAGKTGHDLAKDNPFLRLVADSAAIRDVGAQIVMQDEAEINHVIAVFMNKLDKNAEWETAFLNRMAAVRELRKADEAFNAENASPSKPT